MQRNDEILRMNYYRAELYRRVFSATVTEQDGLTFFISPMGNDGAQDGTHVLADGNVQQILAEWNTVGALKRAPPGCVAATAT